MCNYIEQYKDQLENKSIDFKMRFAKKLIEKKDFVLNDMLDFLDYVFYENIREKDREVSMEEIREFYELAEDIALYNEIHKGLNQEAIEKEIKYIEEHPPKKKYLYLTRKKYYCWRKQNRQKQKWYRYNIYD